MFVRFETASRNAVSLVGALFFTTLLVAASAPGMSLLA